MRISDWSSDVCSSDLLAAPDAALDVGHGRAGAGAHVAVGRGMVELTDLRGQIHPLQQIFDDVGHRRRLSRQKHIKLPIAASKVEMKRPDTRATWAAPDRQGVVKGKGVYGRIKLG